MSETTPPAATSFLQKAENAAKAGLTAVENALGLAKTEGQKVAAAATTVVTTDAPAVQAAIKATETAAVTVAQRPGPPSSKSPPRLPPRPQADCHYCKVTHRLTVGLRSDGQCGFNSRWL